MPFLAPESLGLGDRNALKTYLLERLLHLVEFERLNNRLDFLHRVSSPGSVKAGPIPRNRALVSRSRANASGGREVLSSQGDVGQLA